MDFSELYLTYYSKLVRFAKEFVILEEDAENITQDVFTDLWAKRDSMDRIENMNAYLFRLIKNRCLDHLKHKMFEQKYIESVQTSFEIEMSLKLQSLNRFDVSDISEGNETEMLVRNAINSLPRKCRGYFSKYCRMSDGDSTQKVKGKTKYLPCSMSFNNFIDIFLGVFTGIIVLL